MALKCSGGGGFRALKCSNRLVFFRTLKCPNRVSFKALKCSNRATGTIWKFWMGVGGENKIEIISQHQICHIKSGLNKILPD